MHLYTGLRTKQCKLIAIKKAVLVNNVIIEPRGVIVGITPAMVMLDSGYSDLFAYADGFLNFQAMYRWFLDRYRQEVFHGFVHRWGV
jgi:hypothetical protein